MKPLKPSNELAAVVGLRAVAPATGRQEGLGAHQKGEASEPANKREVVADDKLRAVFGKDRVSMLEMNKHLAQHLK